MPIIPCISIRIIRILVCRREVYSSFIPSLEDMPPSLLYTQLKVSTNVQDEQFLVLVDKKLSYITKKAPKK
jgi:hypothetical protein